MTTETQPTIPQAAPPAPQPPAVTPRTLPSGAAATLRAGTGADLAIARKMAETEDDVPFALISILVKVDGAELDVAAALKLDMFDVIDLMSELGLNAEPEGDKLPSGKPFAVRRGIGEDLRAAQRLMGPNDDPDLVMACVLSTVDGAKILPDDLAAMPLADVLVLSKAVQKQVGPTRAPSTSPS